VVDEYFQCIVVRKCRIGHRTWASVVSESLYCKCDQYFIFCDMFTKTLGIDAFV